MKRSRMIMIVVACSIILVAGTAVFGKGIGGIVRSMTDSYKTFVATDLGLAKTQSGDLSINKETGPIQETADNLRAGPIECEGYRDFNDTDYLLREEESNAAIAANEKAHEAIEAEAMAPESSDKRSGPGGQAAKAKSLPMEGNIPQADASVTPAQKRQTEAVLNNEDLAFHEDDTIPIPQLPLWQGDFEIEVDESPPPDIPFPVFLEDDILAEDMIE